MKYLREFLRSHGPENSGVCEAPTTDETDETLCQLADSHPVDRCDHSDGSLLVQVIPDWRSVVASWPALTWLAWRCRSLELQPESPTADEIRPADRAAYLEIIACEIPTDATRGTDETDETSSRPIPKRSPRRPGFVRFLDLCYAHNIDLYVESGRIRADGQRGLMTADFFEALTFHEANLIASLESFSPQPETAP